MSTPPRENTAAAGPPPADPAVIDLPADARCFQCGYLLRGLTQPRCPECGRAFAPGDYYRAYLPMWPVLLGWFILGYIIRDVLFWGSLVAFVAGRGGSWRTLNAGAFHRMIAVLATSLIGAAAAYGLLRRRPWSRKAALFWAALTAILFLSIYAAYFAGWIGGPSVFRFSNLWSFLQFEWCFYLLPPCIVGVFLLTGMRRARALPLAAWQATPQRDWLAFAVAVFVVAALCMVPVQALVGMVKAGIGLGSLGSLSGGALLSGSALLGAVLVWRDPRRLGWVAGVWTLAFLMMSSFNLWEALAAMKGGSSFWLTFLISASFILGVTLEYGSLLAFAVCLRRHERRQLAAAAGSADAS